MKRTIISAAVLTLLAGGVGVSAADPGPNGKNNRGLCTAYFSGSENGQEHKRKAGPFAALEEAADDGDEETSPAEDVLAFCNETAPGFGNNGTENPGEGGNGGGKGGGKG